jgi:hypothetical protein
MAPILAMFYIILPLSGGVDALQVGCNSNSNVAKNCYDDFSNAAKKMFGQEYEGDRAQTAGEAVKNCVNCASETLSNQLHDFGNNDNNRSGDWAKLIRDHSSHGRTMKRFTKIAIASGLLLLSTQYGAWGSIVIVCIVDRAEINGRVAPPGTPDYYRLDGANLEYYYEEQGRWATACNECGDSGNFAWTLGPSTMSISRYTGKYHQFTNFGNGATISQDGHCSSARDPSKSAHKKFWQEIGWRGESNLGGSLRHRDIAASCCLKNNSILLGWAANDAGALIPTRGWIVVTKIVCRINSIRNLVLVIALSAALPVTGNARAGERRVSISDMRAAEDYCNGLMRFLTIELLNKDTAELQRYCHHALPIAEKMEDAQFYIKTSCACQALLSRLSD